MENLCNDDCMFKEDNKTDSNETAIDLQKFNVFRNLINHWDAINNFISKININIFDDYWNTNKNFISKINFIGFDLESLIMDLIFQHK